MTHGYGHSHINLHELARRAMRERGLEPDFPPATKTLPSAT